MTEQCQIKWVALLKQMQRKSFCAAMDEAKQLLLRLSRSYWLSLFNPKCPSLENDVRSLVLRKPPLELCVNVTQNEIFL